MDKRHQTPHALFEWDSGKAERNQRKHGISFERATEAFGDPFARMDYDIGHSAHEDRFSLLGMVDGTLLVMVIFTEHDVIRIISARKATRQERERYVNQ